MSLRIKNWAQFQHFRNRKPPWIKLYRDLLDDVEWHELDPADAKVLVMLWLIASEGNNGSLPSVKDLAFRLRQPQAHVVSVLSRLSHWILDDADITVISRRYHDDTPETEKRERERESPRG